MCVGDSGAESAVLSARAALPCKVNEANFRMNTKVGRPVDVRRPFIFKARPRPLDCMVMALIRSPAPAGGARVAFD